MNRRLLPTPGFTRAARQIGKRQSGASELIRRTLERLADDPFDPRLKTHKLKGKHYPSWACSVAYDLRIIFSIESTQDVEDIVLLDIGSHDEVY